MSVSLFITAGTVLLVECSLYSQSYLYYLCYFMSGLEIGVYELASLFVKWLKW